MTNLAMPILLAGIIMIAGIFAFMPIDKASTVHTTIATDIDNQDRAFTFTVNGTSGTDVTLLPGTSGKAYVGSFTLSASSTSDAIDCGLTDGGTQIVSGTNATAETPSSGTLDNLASGEGINLKIDGTGKRGICNITIFLNSGND